MSAALTVTFQLFLGAKGPLYAPKPPKGFHMYRRDPLGA
jgi:hypothetical protein